MCTAYAHACRAIMSNAWTTDALKPNLSKPNKSHLTNSTKPFVMYYDGYPTLGRCGGMVNKSTEFNVALGPEYRTL